MDDIYMISILIAIPFAIIGFCLSFFCETSYFGYFGGPIIGLILAWIYICKHIDSTKNRIRLFFSNPVLYYLIFILRVVYDFSKNGFHPWNY